MRCHRSRSWWLLLAAVLVATLWMPAAAKAHAAIVSSEPEAGQELAAAPGAVVLRFTEPLNVSLSRATVTDPTGRVFEGEATGETQIHVSLTTNAPGVYEVDWTTVSTLDGHTLRGSFRFGVGVSPGEASEGMIETAPRRWELAVAVFRALEYLALLLATGMLMALRLARLVPALEWVRPRLGLALGVAFASGVVVVTGEAVAAAESLSLGSVVSYLTTGLPGVARTTRIVAEALLLVGLAIGRGVLAFLLVAILALAAAGHAAAVPWGIPVDFFHLVSAGMWAGGVLALATLRPPGGWKGAFGPALLERFSPIAIPAFLLTLATGTLRGVQELSALRDLVVTPYGQVLSLKVLGVLTMVPLSILAWRRVVGSLRFEAAVAILVVAAAGLLAAFPLPPGRAAESEEEQERSAEEVSALPAPGDLTFGGQAGQVLVGVTIRPAEPGPNDVLVFLLPLEGEEAAAGIPASLVISGRSTPMEECGTTCRRVHLDLQGGETLEIDVRTEVGGSTSFELPDLPPPDGSEVLERAQEQMHAVDTYRLEEVLSSGLAEVRADYAFVAPDRYTMRVIQADEPVAEQIVIGGTRYRRSSPGSSWEKQTGAPVLEVPFFTWDSFLPAVATSVVDSSRIDDVPVEIISFSGNGRLPIWFRLWVDSEGLVRKAEMRAQGHFMDHRYFAFGQPIEIEPPTGG